MIRKWSPLALLVLSIVFPLVFTNPVVTTIGVFTLIYATMASAWNILGGYSGYISLGHASFFGIGAYAVAILAKAWNVSPGWAPFALLLVGGLVAAIISVPFGYLALRTRRHTFVVITIAYFFIFQLLSYNLTGLTNGSSGLPMPIPTWSSGFFNYPFYYVGLALLVLTLCVSWWVRHSRFGLGLLAIRDDEDRAEGLGVKTGPSKLAAFVIAAFFIAMAGGLYGYFVTYLYPATLFNPLNDLAMALMTFTGGIGTLSGPILGAFIIEPARQIFAIAGGASLYLIMYGALFLVIILLLPDGIWPSLRRKLPQWMATRKNHTDDAQNANPRNKAEEEASV
ncbi:branched-chain amino acid ABC transporter permease [Alicyclobacillus sp. ALC3]|uniref:branched-chain amino acid ABC transporter permease n=1 Tax=Alicyclobacillus sp. ALC3 TaxID=2796143 RepID=UPI002379EF6D|nr:branched-chain amino acid ABC transporter permease [Alicyclobacillus sp. ALC3]WDL97575.1 branched-chain amino acid ABC transporter permease [Alicyclobacillus sp. ALC3]